MGSRVTAWAHSRKVAVSAVTMLMLFAGCLEPAMQLESVGATQGAAKNAACSPLNCTGCCAGDVCLGGNTDTACGYDGRECSACPSTHRCEAPGACYPQPMPASARQPEPIPDDVHCYFVDGVMRCQ